MFSLNVTSICVTVGKSSLFELCLAQVLLLFEHVFPLSLSGTACILIEITWNDVTVVGKAELAPLVGDHLSIRETRHPVLLPQRIPIILHLRAVKASHMIGLHVQLKIFLRFEHLRADGTHYFTTSLDFGRSPVLKLLAVT